MAAADTFPTPSKRGFADISFEDGLADRENCSPMRFSQPQAAWSFPATKRFRNHAGEAGIAGFQRPFVEHENSAFPAVGFATSFTSDKVKEFVRVQKMQKRAIGAGGVLAAAAVAEQARGRFVSASGEQAHSMMQQSSPFRTEEEDLADLDDIRHSNMGISSIGGQSNSTPTKVKKQKLFTQADVEKILSTALREQEEALRRQYNDVLAHQLQEQFSNFTKFNQDHIARSLSQSQHDYFG